MSITELRKRAPYRLDQVITYSGNGYRRSARLGKHVACAHGIDESRGRRYRRGDENAPLTHALAYLATCPRTSAWPAIVEGIALVTQIEIERASTEELAARRAELEEIEHQLEAHENRATWARDDDACIEAHARKAEVHLELMAIIRRQKQLREAV